ncbi:MAG: hypothetical protein AB7F59_08660 [Bdellovibrionales bacterium]
MNNSLFLKSCILSAGLLSVLACSPQNPRREAPLETNKVVEISADNNSEVEVNSKLDILFVIDDSNSMGPHQKNMSDNISEFVKAFGKNNLIDFHIGITKVFDSEIQLRKEENRTSRQVKITPAGQLLPLKAPKGLEESIKGQPPYITKATPNYLKVLEASLKVCETAQCPPDGPVFEESFSPVMEAFNETNLSGPNAGFYRPDAHLAIIFITDAEDATKGVSASRLSKYLEELKGGNSKLVSAYGVLVPSSDPNCKRDNGNIPPTKIEKFLSHYGNLPVSLCSKSFGKDLAKIGIDLSRRIDRKVIPLKFVPQMNSLDDVLVTYGGQKINPDFETGWTYIPHDAPGGPAIVLGDKLAIEYKENAKLRIRATPVRMENLTNGRTKKL